MAIIYGIDTDQPVRAEDVRDVVVHCFYEAHCTDASLSDTNDGEGMSRTYCQQIVEKAFDETDGDYSHPDKESLIRVLDYLAKFSKEFRGEAEIKKHYHDVMQLIDALE